MPDKRTEMPLQSQARYWRTVDAWHTFFNAWRPWSYEGSEDGTTWYPIPGRPEGCERMESRRRTDITDD